MKISKDKIMKEIKKHEKQRDIDLENGLAENAVVEHYILNTLRWVLKKGEK